MSPCCKKHSMLFSVLLLHVLHTTTSKHWIASDTYLAFNKSCKQINVIKKYIMHHLVTRKAYYGIACHNKRKKKQSVDELENS